MKFSVAHATARPNGWRYTFERVMNRASRPHDVEYVLSCDPRFGDFEQSLQNLDFPIKAIALPGTERKCAASNFINAIEHTNGDILILNSDDFAFPASWDANLSFLIGDRDPLTQPFAVHVSTGSPRDDGLMTLQIGSRALLERWGYLIWHEYDGMCMDDDFTAHAYADPGVEVIGARHLMFEHLHYSFNKAEFDEVYAHENRPDGYDLGFKIFQRRLKEGFK